MFNKIKNYELWSNEIYEKRYEILEILTFDHKFQIKNKSR